MEKWVCAKCEAEVSEKPKKNQTCKCKGRFRHYRQCADCGEWFFDMHYNRKLCDKCSHSAGRDRKGKVELICDNCGNAFFRYAGNVSTGKNYCSRKCMEEKKKAERIYKVCEVCGRDFSVYASVIKQSNAAGRFCSSRCYYESMTLDKERNYRGFRTAKERYFSTKQFCAVCGTTENINIHHIVPNRITHDQSKDNLIPLCAKHHPQIERVSKSFIDAMGGDIEKAGELLKIALRDRQFQTYAMIKAQKQTAGT